MSLLINSIATSSKTIPYRKELREICGSATGAILFQQLLFWFNSNENKPFYKFLENCDHPSCKEEDTWTVELGFSKSEFVTAFEKIGVKYKSKTEYKENQDKFQNKFFLAYFDRQTGLTWYHMNLESVEKALTSIYCKSTKLISRNQQSSLTEINKVNLLLETENTTENTNIDKKENIKEKIISEPKNSNQIPNQNLKIEETKNIPIFGLNRNSKFPNLSDSEIDLELETYFLSYPRASFSSIMNYLASQDLKKLETQKKKDWYEKKEKQSEGWQKSQQQNQTFRENEQKHEQTKNLSPVSPKLFNQFGTNSVTGNLLSSDNQNPTKDPLEAKEQQKTELLRQEAKRIAMEKIESKTYSRDDYPNFKILPGIWKQMSNFGTSESLKESFLGFLTNLEIKKLKQTN